MIGRGAPPGARASRPHALPLRAAQFPSDGAPGTLPAGTAWTRPKQSPDAPRERGRLARMHSRRVPLSFAAIWHLAALPAEAPWIRAKQSPRRKRPPGARASRPHAQPSRAAQFPCDMASGRPAGRSAMDSGEAESQEETPPGSAGVSPACTAVACRSVSPRWGTRPPCRQERHGPGRGSVLAPLPVDPGGADGRGCARTCAGGTPALPGGVPQSGRSAPSAVQRSGPAIFDAH